jgi:L-seryl-tRNA(Ser) seleniumtransferase
MADDDDDTSGERQAALRALPAVSTVLARPAVREAAAALGLPTVTRAVRDVVEAVRQTVRAGGRGEVTDEGVCARARGLARGSLRPVLNATGVIVHTNLGRAPLAPAAIAAIAELGAGYATLEYDLEEGGRGERHGHARELLVELTGAEDAAVVNNNAAAVLLMLAALAARREVVVSRGELVEIGGGFRIPDVLAQSGARLVEVGTTNRTHLRDYERAIGPETALLLKVHRSNFAVVGFTAEVSVRELSVLARTRGIALACDAGSGCFASALAGPDEPTVRELVSAGADLVTFSGDKLLGGPQAGIVVGRRAYVEPLRRHPLMRALRPDKLSLAALLATLRLWRDDPAAVPVLRLASIAAEEIERRCRSLAAGQLANDSRVSVVPTVARLGGGAAPLREIPSFGLRVAAPDPDALLARLRERDPAIVARIEDGAAILDLRCVPEAADDLVARALADG